jgi:hypothetical protein
MNEHVSFKNACNACQAVTRHAEDLCFMLCCISALQSQDEAGKGHVAVKGAVVCWYLFEVCVILSLIFHCTYEAYNV